MTFRDALDKHLRAIRERDLRALIETLPAGRLTLVMAEGELVQSAEKFVELHKGWFQQTTWTLDTTLVNVVESRDMGVATLRLEYRDTLPGGAPLLQFSYLTLVFVLEKDGRWVMVLDQNTPIRVTEQPAVVTEGEGS